jgi:hypothetical protein
MLCQVEDFDDQGEGATELCSRVVAVDDEQAVAALGEKAERLMSHALEIHWRILLNGILNIVARFLVAVRVVGIRKGKQGTKKQVDTGTCEKKATMTVTDRQPNVVLNPSAAF